MAKQIFKVKLLKVEMNRLRVNHWGDVGHCNGHPLGVQYQ